MRARGSGVSDATASYALTVQAAPVNNGSFALAASPATLSVAAGANGTSTINITRTAPFTGAVNLAVSGAPAGVTATLSAASVAGTSATLTVAVAAGTAATTATLTISGTATGVSNQSTTIALTTTAATGGTGNIVWRFCDGSTVPWFAVQDGNGAWTRVIGANNSFSFNLTNDRGGVAYVVPVEADVNRVPAGKRCRVYRTEDAGKSWQELSAGLPDEDHYGMVLRDALRLDDGDPAGVYFGNRNGEVYASADEGDSWRLVAAHLPEVLCVRAAREMNRYRLRQGDLL